MLLKDVIGKARSLVNNAVTRSIVVYDSSKNKIIVSGLNLDGVVKATLSARKIGELSNGTDEAYFGYYDVWDTYLLEVVLLPTAKAVDALQMLSLSQRIYKGHCKVSILENGESLGTYVGYIAGTPSIDLQKESDDRTFSFVLKQPKITANILPSTLTQTETEAGNATTVNETVINQA